MGMPLAAGSRENPFDLTGRCHIAEIRLNMIAADTVNGRPSTKA
jgi:hypothetical protein